MIDLGKIDTEKRNPNTMNIDQENVSNILKRINEEDKKVANSIEEKLGEVEEVVNAAIKVHENGGRIIYVGAGTSGRIGVLDAVECPPTYGVAPDRVIGLMAGGEEAFIKAKEGAEDDEELGKQDLIDINLTADDLVIGVAASGRTPYVIGALNYANEIDASTASIAITSNSKVGEIADNKIEVVVGPEVVTGSTRMKAGTAQKLILNMISTTVMIKTGKVFENLMVDVMQTNEKLKIRARNIVMEATDCSEETASEKLAEANGSAKTAIVMILNNLNAAEAQELLDDNKGFIR